MPRAPRFLIAAALLLAAPLATAQPVAIKFGNNAPPKAHLNVQVFGPWAEKVTRESGGTLRVDFMPGGALGTDGQLVDRMASGVADIVFDLQAYYPGRFPKTEVTTLPFLFDTSTEGSIALWRAVEKGVIDEYRDFTVLNLWAFTNVVVMSKKPVRSLDDLKGEKVIVGGKTRTSVVSALGAVPVSITIGETYQALNRGVATASLQPYTALQPFRLVEVTGNYFHVPLGGSTGMMIMNRTKFDSLPPPAKKAILDNSGEPFVRSFAAFWDRIEKEGMGMIESRGQSITRPAPDEIAKWRAAVAPVVDGWMKATPDGNRVYETFRAEVQRAKQGG